MNKYDSKIGFLKKPLLYTLPFLLSACTSTRYLQISDGFADFNTGDTTAQVEQTDKNFKPIKGYPSSRWSRKQIEDLVNYPTDNKKIVENIFGKGLTENYKSEKINWPKTLALIIGIVAATKCGYDFLHQSGNDRDGGPGLE